MRSSRGILITTTVAAMAAWTMVSMMIGQPDNGSLWGVPFDNLKSAWGAHGSTLLGYGFVFGLVYGTIACIGLWVRGVSGGIEWLLSATIGFPVGVFLGERAYLDGIWLPLSVVDGLFYIGLIGGMTQALISYRGARLQARALVALGYAASWWLASLPIRFIADPQVGRLLFGPILGVLLGMIEAIARADTSRRIVGVSRAPAAG